MAGGLLVGLSKALGASKIIGGASKVVGASKGLIRRAVVPTTVRGGVTRAGLTSMIGGGNRGGGTISPSNFAVSSVNSRISNISASVSSSSSGGLGDMLNSESIMGRRTGEDTTQDFLDTFGSDKTSKVIRSSLMVLRDTFVETFETARILRTALNQTSGIGGGFGGGNQGGRGGLLGALTSPLGLLATGAGVGGASGALSKKMRPKTAITGDVIENTTKAAGKSDDVAKAGLNLGKNFNNIKKSVGQGLKGAKNVGGDLLQKGSKFIKNPKKALGALAIGGLGFLGVKTLTGGGGNKEQDVVTKLDSVLDKWSASIDDQSKDSGEDKNVISTSGNATLERGKVVSGNMSQADAEKAKQKLKLESAKFDAISTYGYKSPEANEIRKKLMMLSGTPEEAIYTDKKGNLRRKGFSTYGGKTTVSDKKGGGFGLKRMFGGIADAMTGGIFDFDKRGSNKIQKMQQGIADFMTLGMFDFDKKNRKGAPKGFGLKRIMGGVADAITMGTTDFDKRGAGIGQYSGFTGRRGKRNPNQKRINEILLGPPSQEAALELQRLGHHSARINSWMRRKKMMATYDKIPKTITVSPDGSSITSKGSGSIIGGEVFRTGQPLSEKQYGVMSMSMQMGNRYGDDAMKAYNLYKTEQNRVKLNSQNTSVPKSVKKTPKVINVPSSGVPSGANNSGSPGGGTLNTSGSSGAGSNIAFPSSHNGVSYAAVETQSQMNLVMAD